MAMRRTFDDDRLPWFPGRQEVVQPRAPRVDTGLPTRAHRRQHLRQRRPCEQELVVAPTSTPTPAADPAGNVPPKKGLLASLTDMKNGLIAVIAEVGRMSGLYTNVRDDLDLQQFQIFQVLQLRLGGVSKEERRRYPSTCPGLPLTKIATE